MPTITIKIPLPNQSLTFAQRARRKAGMGAIFSQQPVVLPGPNVFRAGIGSFFAQRSIAPFGPNVFVPPKGLGAFPRKGLSAFTIIPSPPPCLPGNNVFAPYLKKNCSACSRPCHKRGMGQDDGDQPGINYAWNAAGVDPGMAPILESTSDLGGTLLPQNDAEIFSSPVASPTVSTVTASPTLGGSGWQVGGDTATASSNPSLDAFNQALTNAAASNPALTSASVLGKLGTTLATATPAQLQAATASLTPSTGFSLAGISSWLTANMGTVLLMGGGIAALALISSRKGKR